MWGPLISAGVGLLGQMLSNNGSDDQTANLLQQIPGIGKQHYDPFIQRGAQAQDMASDAYGKMLQNPASFVEQIMSSYKPSEGYNFKKKNTLNAARNSAASGGFSGTEYDQMQQSEMANGLLGQDMQQYLQNIFGVQGQGMAGQQHVGDMGYNASSSLADYLGNSLGAQAGLSFQQNQQKNQNKAGMMGGLSGMLNQGIGLLGSGQLGGAGSFGGPGGGLSKIFGGLAGGLGGGYGGFK